MIRGQSAYVTAANPGISGGAHQRGRSVTVNKICKQCFWRDLLIQLKDFIKQRRLQQEQLAN